MWWKRIIGSESGSSNQSDNRRFQSFQRRIYVKIVTESKKEATHQRHEYNQRNFIDYKSWIIFALVFGASIKKTDPILLIVLAGIAGYFLY